MRRILLVGFLLFTILSVYPTGIYAQSHGGDPGGGTGGDPSGSYTNPIETESTPSNVAIHFTDDFWRDLWSEDGGQTWNVTVPPGGGNDSTYNDDSSYPDGNYPPNTYEVVGKVWLDSNGDASINNGEAGFGGQAVYLQNAAGTGNYAGRTTDSGGSYLFGNLGAGSDYRITYYTPAGYVRTNDNSSTLSLGPDYRKDFGIRMTVPVVTNAYINTSPVNPNGTQYTITVTGTNEGDGSWISEASAIVNYQGGNSPYYRGLLGWSNRGFPQWGAGTYFAPINCSGGGQAARYNGYGEGYLTLHSCSTSTSGTQRTVNFTISYNNQFTTPETNNTISGWVYNILNQADGWKPFGTFSIIPPPPSIAPVSPYSACFDSADSGSKMRISWTSTGVTWVDIDNDGNWGNGYYHKAVSGVSSTTADGFNAFPSGGALTFNPNTNYYVRIYNQQGNSNATLFNFPTCSFNYSLSNSGQIIVARGRSASNSISATRIEGPTQTVTLVVTGLPTAATADLTPSASVTPTDSRTLTITTHATNTPLGTYTITVTGTSSGGLIRTTQFSLTVGVAPWIQTRQGDVYSGGGIDAPGGP